MNKYFQILHHAGQKRSRRIVGLMSGTSLDGLDVALCSFQGSGMRTRAEVSGFKSVEYPEGLHRKLHQICFKEHIPGRELTELNTELGRFFGQTVKAYLEEWGVAPSSVDCVASHGQTIYHAPLQKKGRGDRTHSTLQGGDGDHIAWRSGIPVVSDFRQKHIAAGGEGAPLALYGDLYLFGKENESRILLNIGGISNITWLDGSLSFGNIVTTDVGPGNTLINQAVNRYFSGRHYDHNGDIARSGNVEQDLLDTLMGHPFFRQAFPKSTGPETFSWNTVEKALNETGKDVAVEDIIATLTDFTVQSIIKGVEALAKEAAPSKLIVSGGGVHNLAIMEGLKEYYGSKKVVSLADLGVDPDAKEALLFALLANEYLCGNPLPVFGSSKPDSALLGKLSLPG